MAVKREWSEKHGREVWGFDARIVEQEPIAKPYVF